MNLEKPPREQKTEIVDAQKESDAETIRLQEQREATDLVKNFLTSDINQRVKDQLKPAVPFNRGPGTGVDIRTDVGKFLSSDPEAKRLERMRLMGPSNEEFKNYARGKLGAYLKNLLPVLRELGRNQHRTEEEEKRYQFAARRVREFRKTAEVLGVDAEPNESAPSKNGVAESGEEKSEKLRQLRDEILGNSSSAKSHEASVAPQPDTLRLKNIADTLSRAEKGKLHAAWPEILNSFGIKESGIATDEQEKYDIFKSGSPFMVEQGSEGMRIIWRAPN